MNENRSFFDTDTDAVPEEDTTTAMFEQMSGTDPHDSPNSCHPF